MKIFLKIKEIDRQIPPQRVVSANQNEVLIYDTLFLALLLVIRFV